MYKQETKKGVTMLEIIIAIGVLALISSIVLISLSKFKNNSLLALETENIVSLIANARINTLSSKNDDVYSVHLESARAVLFKGEVFNEPNTKNLEIIFDSKITLSDISLNGSGSDIIFKRLSGKTDQYGTLSVAVASATTTQNTIYIYETGFVDVD